MTRRLLFGLAAGFGTLVVIAAGLDLVTSADVSPWILATGVASAFFFGAGVMIVLRDVLRALWTLEGSQKRQAATVAAINKSLGEGRTIEAKRYLEVRADIDSLTKAVGGLAGGFDETAIRIERDHAERIRPALDRIERDHAERIRPALDRIEREHAERIRPALERILPELKGVAREQVTGYRQVEALVGLASVLGLRAPLPPLRRTWAISPDAAALLVRLVFERRPKHVLEIGSGVSTVLVARALELIGSGTLESVEHLPGFVDATSRLLESQDLLSIATIIEAELKDLEIGGAAWRWYDVETLADVNAIDLLVVDGPPGSTGSLARYPALPILADRLSDGALILLDDAAREDEIRVVERWKAEFPVAAIEVPHTEKGVAVLEWRSSR